MKKSAILHLISRLTRFNKSMSEIALWSARQQCANNYTAKHHYKNLPVLWHTIREPCINVPACMKDLRGRSVCWVNIRTCIQNNYMPHCCDKNGPRQQLFAANLVWEVPNSGGKNLIGYCVSAATLSCRLLPVKVAPLQLFRMTDKNDSTKLDTWFAVITVYSVHCALSDLYFNSLIEESLNYDAFFLHCVAFSQFCSNSGSNYLRKKA